MLILQIHLEQLILGSTSENLYELDNKDDGEWLGLKESYRSRSVHRVQELERNTSEGSRIPEKMSSPKTKPRSPKTKNKSAFKVQELRDESSDDEGGVFASFHNKKWYSPNLKFPCPVGKHQHELNTCAEFFAMNPVERWNKMDKGKICYLCLAPKDVCTTRRCSLENKVPESLKCHGCAPWASSKNLAPFSILFCRNKKHAGLRADFKDIKRDLEKYMGKLGTAVADASIKFSVNYMKYSFLDPFFFPL